MFCISLSHFPFELFILTATIAMKICFSYGMSCFYVMGKGYGDVLRPLAAKGIRSTATGHKAALKNP